MKMTWLIMVALVLPGCIVVPVPHPATVLRGRPGVSGPGSWAFVEMGQTNREEVVVRLGEPDYRWRSDGVLVYHWVTTEWLILWAVAGNGAAAGGAYDVPIGHFLVVSLDERGWVSGVEEKHDEGLCIVSVQELKEKLETKRGGP